MPDLINWGIIKHPLNWLTIWAMLLITGYAVHLVLSHYNSDSLSGVSNVPNSER